MTIKTFDDLIEEREKVFDPDVSNKWIWPKADQGAWYGPDLNWQHHHRTTYFKHIKNYRTVVTAGANCGFHARVFGHRFKTVYAFEPDWLNFYCLTRNCPEENIIKIQAALGDRDGLCAVKLSDDRGNVGCHTIDDTISGKIPIFRLDTLQLSDLDFLQLDVEGYEDRVIIGALETIKKYKPVIAVETLPGDSRDIIEGFGYVMDTEKSVDMIFYHKGE